MSSCKINAEKDLVFKSKLDTFVQKTNRHHAYLSILNYKHYHESSFVSDPYERYFVERIQTDYFDNLSHHSLPLGRRKIGLG